MHVHIQLLVLLMVLKWQLIGIYTAKETYVCVTCEKLRLVSYSIIYY